jgi:uncharacterized protein
MVLGILSDTHDRADAMAAGVALLQSRGAEFFIHCGDVGSTRILDYLAGLRSAFVWGNCDYDRPALQHYGQLIGVPCYGSFADLELGGKKVAAIHGDDHRLKQQLLAEQRHDYLLQGHTHVREDKRVGQVRVINPGALHRANPKTVALLDTVADRLEFLEVAGGVGSG